MNASRLVSAVGLVSALAVSGYGNQVTAQGGLIVGGPTARYGSRVIAQGFMPDPLTLNVVAGGSLDLSSAGLQDRFAHTPCVGWTHAQPTAIINITNRIPVLRVYVLGSGDTTLLINTASGNWRCNDDSPTGPNPFIEMRNTTPGQYDIWVGSYAAGASVRGQLVVTETDSRP